MVVDLDVASEFVCCMYAQSKTRSVNEARYNKLMQMSGKVDKVGKAKTNMIIIIKVTIVIIMIIIKDLIKHRICLKRRPRHFQSHKQ